MRRDCRYCATVSRGESFFALATNDVKALEVSVEGENIAVYALMSAGVTLEVSQHYSVPSLSHYYCEGYIRLVPCHAIDTYISNRQSQSAVVFVTGSWQRTRPCKHRHWESQDQRS